jgi:hypothetical protein
VDNTTNTVANKGVSFFLLKVTNYDNILDMVTGVTKPQVSFILAICDAVYAANIIRY